MNQKTIWSVVVGLILCAGIVGCSGGESSTSNADVTDAAKSMSDQSKSTPSGPALHSFGGKPGGAMKPHAAGN